MSWLRGSVKGPADLAPIDAAYAELVAAGLLSADNMPINVLPGERRTPFTLTAAGNGLRHLVRP
jgi:hypothetical protein